MSEKLNKLVKKIKEKKSLKKIDDKLVLEQINKFTTPKTNLEKKKDFKKILKQIRNELNKIYGQYQLKESLTLQSHKSTKERSPYYKDLYKNIFQITGKPKSILDLASGLNPLSYKFLNCKPKYIATELTKEDVNNLNYYFKKNKINAKAIQKDLTKQKTFPKTDITFLFKVLDTIETKGHKLSEQIIKNLKSKYIIVSFSTLTVKGQRMRYPRRGWFEQMLKRLNIEYKKIIIPNEIFYILKK